jgi:hypothetical protein
VIYLADADSKMPNLALMRLATRFRALGETVRRVRPADRRAKGDTDGLVYGSSIFAFAHKARETMERQWGPIVWGGTGVRVESSLAEVDASVEWDGVPCAYDLYPDFAPSIGFLTRGCRLRCSFCCVPTKEGKPRAVALPLDVWRGDGHPRHLELLDNDAFAPQLREHWREAVRQMRDGGFRVCFSQGLNLRLIDDESAAAVASLTYTDHSFSLRSRRLYTAWDNLGDEGVFRRGVATLARAGIPGHRLNVYMLVGYRQGETWDEVFYRYRELRALGCTPFPMVYDKAARPDLAAFARYAYGYTKGKVPWPEYRPGRRGEREARLTPEAIEVSDAAWARVQGGWKPVNRKLRML